jgi:hypothetical protein
MEFPEGKSMNARIYHGERVRKFSCRAFKRELIWLFGRQFLISLMPTVYGIAVWL